ncbi:phosphoribosylformimino-5-aminoimidazole carboxamide ribotide isomerase [Kwoniella mangroviensis CBS 8886]|uniref:phosphoribosylformimino-5-aminoimidazole carboxamide ribotide isomerase n=1 Tax=Kwoniella mangroviensis CBS 8507 TaxID=1296122 RepID=UPI00080CD29E|nr:phosphoribosylformimino-5-aminoimidazole carboxamide ribotide isomerase [Kwoniella mangroviensis CBS 8507]OCF65918.1 phosphoribosylformimino-5-aminoimidazole carboxamide ribotide isomerase [Kwoniella mangroviensis CBS 8507]OCF72007.1 phosphoribosylformimino-5-aminoimidazole carboxamide ribotide isomerase [Kwoniella mangroviensis CBS 8886]
MASSSSSSSSSTHTEKRRHSQFRPCIDLHQGVVKQIVGGTLDLTSEDTSKGPKENFVATHPPSYFANLYKSHNLTGGHIIKLGPDNDQAAKEALSTWSKGMQVGGGINEDNAQEWLDLGADKIIVTSYLFPGGKFDESRLKRLSDNVGKDNLVVDISCRKKENGWIVAMNGWKTLTDMYVTQESIQLIEQYCSELLIHAADVEGLCQGIDEELVIKLGEWVNIPTTYAGGAKDISDLKSVDTLSKGKVDLTFGSSLDIFGGKGVKFDELVEVDRLTKELSA